jgi:alanyl-tRNA synthetase
MNAADVRQSFIQYFQDRGHREVASSPLVPQGDPTLLFTNAGMVQFKDTFLGREPRDYRRAVTVQKCLRVSGKHNDLENVGPSPRHHTFFEMLGNFSFGDYFKADAIRFGWELVTAVWGLPAERLFATVYEEDDEAFELWQQLSTLPAGRIHRCGKKDNFWAMGDTGPCGPCSEIFVDLEPGSPAEDWETGTDRGRYLEIWNLVFMQFDRDSKGTLAPLPNPSIDTGAGLERVTAVLQGHGSNYDTDLFQPILRQAAALAGTAYGRDARADTSLRVVADHLRAVTFLLGDGVIPGNEGRGYVLRRILRRAVRHGMRLGFEEPFFHRLVPVVREILGGAYPQLQATESATVDAVRTEEEKFLTTVAAGARQVQEAIESAKAAGRTTIDGATLFRLHDTHGFALELVREIAEEERFGLDEAGFGAALDEQRRRSRSATGDQQKRLQALREALRGEGELPATRFDGYEHLTMGSARVLRLARLAGGEASSSALPTPVLAAGERGVAILDQTVFYAESGGQVGDLGTFTWEGGAGRVVDTQKDPSGAIFHFIAVERGELSPGAAVELAVAAPVRRATERNHTATHLLHAAMREVLGKGVRQAGSLVAPDRLRFDFTHTQPVSADERRRIETLANHWIREAVPVAITQRSYKEAVAAGAMALFGEKYGEVVRTVAVPGFSLELCGGCHVRNTGEIGFLVITGEKGVASGVRRLEAQTGDGALAWLAERERLLADVEQATGVPVERAPAAVAALRGKLEATEAELAKLRLQLASGSAGGAGDDVLTVGDARLLVKEVPPAPAGELRSIADVLRQKLGSGVVALGTREDGKVTLLVAVTSDLADRVDAGALVRAAAPLVGGSGGGRRDFAQAGGKDPGKLAEALSRIREDARAALGG